MFCQVLPNKIEEYILDGEESQNTCESFPKIIIRKWFIYCKDLLKIVEMN